MPDELDTEVNKPATAVAALRDSADRQLDSAIRRTQLAANRTVLAADRTYTAWIRTGLAAIAFGVGARALLEDLVPSWLASLTASFLILFSGGCFVAAMWRALRPSAHPPEAEARRVPLAILLFVNGFLLLVCLAALIGMWVVRL